MMKNKFRIPSSPIRLVWGGRDARLNVKFHYL